MRTADAVSVWWQNGVPERLVWQGRRYRVSDTPTVLGEDFFGLTHLPSRASSSGWRLQGTTDDGVTHMFELRFEDRHWRVARAYD
ncbi:hypothetical protein [Parafrigoribacterium soli]|uniref:hypothetical protein n=1 Tax=Parafrigoribacterium soli TaxID=3144663 RepID=UPI0032EB1E24